MSTALAECLSAVREMETNRRDAYRQLVTLLAGDDVEFDPVEVVSVVTAAGKTMDDLSRDTDRLSNRRVAAATLADLPAREKAAAAAELKAERVTRAADDELARVLADLERQRAAAVTRRNQAVAEADAALGAARTAVGECHAARETLLATADPLLVARLERLKGERAVARSQADMWKLKLAADDAVIAANPIPPERDEAANPFVGNELTVSRARQDERRAREAAARIVRLAQERRAFATAHVARYEADVARLDKEIRQTADALLLP